MAKESRAFGTQRARKQHLLRGTGGLQAEIQDLRNDVEEGFQNLEERGGFPELDYHDLTDGAVAAAGGDITLVGRELLQDQTFDEVVITDATNLGSVTLTALKPGDSGITVVVEASAGALAIAYDSNTKVLTISPQVTTGDTDDAIATAINADGADTDGHIRAESAGAGSINFAADQAAVAMAGGVGDYAGNKVMVAGEEALPINTPGTTGAAAWTDTSVKVTVPSLTGGQVGDHAQITVSSDGTRTDALTAVLT